MEYPSLLPLLVIARVVESCHLHLAYYLGDLVFLPLVF